VHFLGVEMDLCNLRSVYDAARKIKGENGGLGIPDMTTSEGLRRDDGRGIGLKNIRIPRLDVLVCNAGIGGFIGMDWPKAIFQVTTNLIQGTTWPTFKIARVGSMIPNDNGASSKPRTSGDSSQALLDASGGTREEKDGPVLAEVFTANLFGHYILGHELMPLLSSTEGKDNKDRGRMIFVSSIECAGLHFDLNDFQGIKTSHPYESSKRLTDILTLSAHLPSVRKYSVSYFHCPSSLSQPTPNGNTNPSEPQSRKPDLYLAHPGVCATEIANLPGILAFFMTLSFYLARLCGSIWHPIRSYAGACALTFLALTPSSFLYSKEGRHPDSGAGDKRVKWGSCTDRWGHERVRRTEVEGWGMSGVVGEVEEAEMVGRRPGARELSEEERVEFEVLGAECWREMERLRGIWERRLGEGGFRLKK
jgi:3-keto steroid reductase